MGLKVVTSYFAAPALRRRPDLVRVGIVLAKPWWWVGELPNVEELAPAPHTLGLKGEEFERAYRRKLERVGVETIRARLAQVSEEHGGRELVLLCYEKDREACHRGIFAAWWHERTGDLLAEL